MPSCHDFILQIGPARGGRHAVQVLESPAGQARGTFEVPWTGEEIGLFFERLPRGRRRGVQAVTTAEVKAVEPPTAEELGGRLFDALFRDKIRDAYLRSRECLGAQGLRLQLRLDPSIGEAAALHRLPWELLYRADAKEWIARDRRTPIVRYLAVDHPAKLPPVPRPLRLLVVMANPRGSVPLDLESERRNLEKLWRQHAAVEVEILPRPEETTTLRNVRETLREAELRGEDFHVLHFMGHGHIDPATGEGRLDFEDEAGENDAVSGADLADVLVDVSGVRLVVLNACHSGEMNRANPAAGVATSLVRGGMPAVIAMQTAITDRAAAAFSRELYHVLACGEPLDAAVTEGRRAIGRPEKTAEWAVPMLFLRSRSSRLFAEPPPDFKSPPRPLDWFLRRSAPAAVGSFVASLALAAVLFGFPEDPCAICPDLACSPPGGRRVLVGSFESLSPEDGLGPIWAGETEGSLIQELGLVEGFEILGDPEALTPEQMAHCVDVAIHGTVTSVDETVALDARLSKNGGIHLATVAAKGVPEDPGHSLLRVQDELAFGILDALEVEVDPELRRRILETPTSSAEALELNRRGIASFLEGNDLAAKLQFRAALERDPRYADALANLGRVELAEESYEAAARHLEEAITILPRQPIYHLNLGLARGYGGDLEGAIRAYERALELDPSYAKAGNNLGFVLRELGRLDAARAALEGALAYASDERIEASLYKNLGRVALEAGAPAEALAYFNTALERFETYPETLFYRATTLARLGRNDAACADWRTYFEIAEGDPEPSRPAEAARRRATLNCPSEDDR